VAVTRREPDAGRFSYAEAVERPALAVLARHKASRPLLTKFEIQAAVPLQVRAVSRDAATGISAAAASIAGRIVHANERRESSRIVCPQSRSIGPSTAVH
jgi:hypothetical protein